MLHPRRQVEHPAITHEGVEYQAFTSQHSLPLTFTGRFMEHLVSPDMIEFVSGAWRTFQDYFRLLLEFGQMGRQQRAFLFLRQVDARLLDMYLGNDSPMYGPGLLVEPNPQRPRKPMGTKQFAPDFSRLMAVAALLVCAAVLALSPCVWCLRVHERICPRRACTFTYPVHARSTARSAHLRERHRFTVFLFVHPQVRSTSTPMQARGSDLPATTIIYNDERDESLRARFRDALARAGRQADNKPASLAPQQVLGDDAPFPLSKVVQTVVVNDVFVNAVLARNDNPEALAEVRTRV